MAFPAPSDQQRAPVTRGRVEGNGHAAQATVLRHEATEVHVLEALSRHPRCEAFASSFYHVAYNVESYHIIAAYLYLYILHDS